MEKQPYQIEYDEFISSYKTTSVSGEDVGFLIAKLAQYYSEKNITLGLAATNLNKISANIANSLDNSNLKTISVAKADILIKDTDEHRQYSRIKIDVENIDQMINALKSLQKGILNEYSHVANI